MKTWQCRMVGLDDANEWTAVEAFTSVAAAQRYAERCDESSGGELYDEDDDRNVVEVRLIGSNEVRRFEVRVAFEKNFYADLKAA
jgi:hypothetical protein